MKWTAPTDLPEPPRRLRRRRDRGWGPVASLWFLRIFMLPHTLAGAGLIIAAVFGVFVWLFGTDVAGHITQLEVWRGKKGPTHHVGYVYSVNGIDYPKSTNVGSDIYEALHVGQEYPVRVFTPAPTWMPLPRGPGSSGTVFMMPFFALLWNGIIFVFVWAAWISPWRARSLLRHGLATAGVIVHKEFRRGGKGGPHYFVRYRYEVTPQDKGHVLATPETFERKMYITAADYAKASVDRAATVIYHPQRPKRSVIYEYAEYEVIG
jgi:hypothetical protein